MKFIIQLILIFVLAYILELFLPWYSLAVVAMVIGYAFHSKANFSAGFLAIALLWFFKAWMQDAGTSAFTGTVAQIFSLPDTWMLFAITAVVGGLVGGFACLSGSLLRKEKKKYY